MSFTRYPSYKDSGVEWLGEVPEGWDFRNLQDTAKGEAYSFVDGPFGSDLKNQEYTDAGIPLIQLNNIAEGLHLLNEIRYVSEDKADDLGKHNAMPGDIVIAKMAHPVARAAIVRSDFSRYVIVADCIRLSVDENKACPNFLVYAINSAYFRASAESVSSGITRLRINLGTLKKLKVTLPSLPEQQTIATFLDRETAKIDALVAEQENLIALLKEKRQAVISHTVTKGLDPTAPMKDSGIEWLGAVPAHWGHTPIKFVLHTIIDTEHKTVPFYDDGEYLVVRTSNIRNGSLILDEAKYTDLSGYLEWTRRGIPAPGDILFTREAPAGEACLVPDDIKLCVGQRTVTLCVDRTKLNPKFGLWSLYGGISAKFISDLSQGSTVAHFNMSDIGNIPLMLPDTEEQKAVAAFIDTETAKIDTLTAEAQRAIDLLKERRSALISAAVTGKIDVRGYHAHPQPIV